MATPAHHDSTQGLSPWAIGVALGLGAVVWQVVDLLGRVLR